MQFLFPTGAFSLHCFQSQEQNKTFPIMVCLWFFFLVLLFFFNTVLKLFFSHCYEIFMYTNISWSHFPKTVITAYQ